LISSLKKTVYQLIIFLIFHSTHFVSAQSGNLIFEGFYEGMTKEQVLTEYENNYSKYSNVFFTGGIDWEIALNGFSYNEYNLLYGIDMIPITKRNNESSYDFTKNCLNAAKDFINSQGFQIFYKPDHWNDPSRFNSFWGLIMINKEKSLAAHFFPSKLNILIKGQPGYQAHLRFISYEPFINEFENLKLYYDY